MDRELEICGRGSVPEQEVLPGPVGAARNTSIRIRGHAVEKVPPPALLLFSWNLTNRSPP